MKGQDRGGYEKNYLCNVEYCITNIPEKVASVESCTSVILARPACGWKLLRLILPLVSICSADESVDSRL